MDSFSLHRSTIVIFFAYINLVLFLVFLIDFGFFSLISYVLTLATLEDHAVRAAFLTAPTVHTTAETDTKDYKREDKQCCDREVP